MLLLHNYQNITYKILLNKNLNNFAFCNLDYNKNLQILFSENKTGEECKITDYGKSHSYSAIIISSNFPNFWTLSV